MAMHVYIKHVTFIKLGNYIEMKMAKGRFVGF